MVYLLDANVLIDANRDYYEMGRVPEFWDWLEFHATEGHIKVPVEIYEEVVEGKPDDLVNWLKRDTIRDAIFLDEEADPALVARVVSEGYAPDLTDEDVEKIGRDPFVIAYALAALGHRTVVTHEVSAPRKQRANRKIPDVCATLAIPSCNTFAITKALNFSTSFREGV